MAPGVLQSWDSGSLGGGGRPGLLWVGLYDLTSSFESSCGVVENTAVCARVRVCVCTHMLAQDRERMHV